MRLLISGSPSLTSSNTRLLKAIADRDPGNNYRLAHYLANIPVFQPEHDQAPLPDTVLEWRADLQVAEAVFICTPAYLHNIPGVLKNALDWLASSGELVGKPTVAMTFTPAPPRGEKAMQSLVWSLSALDARVITTIDLYQRDTKWSEEGRLEDGTTSEILDALLDQL